MIRVDFFYIQVLSVILCFNYVKSVPNKYCLSPLNRTDCGLEPTPVFSYYKYGSRCEIETWRGCPTTNMFENEFHCSHYCIGKLKYYGREKGSWDGRLSESIIDLSIAELEKVYKLLDKAEEVETNEIEESSKEKLIHKNPLMPKLVTDSCQEKLHAHTPIRPDTVEETDEEYDDTHHTKDNHPEVTSDNHPEVTSDSHSEVTSDNHRERVTHTITRGPVTGTTDEFVYGTVI